MKRKIRSAKKKNILSKRRGYMIPSWCFEWEFFRLRLNPRAKPWHGLPA